MNLIAILAIGFAVAIFAGHMLLASTGNGSWVDVAIDVVGLATLGVGKAMMKGAKGAHQAVRVAGSQASGRAAASSVRASTRAQRVALANRVGRGGRRARAAARAQLDALKAQTNRAARAASERARRDALNAPLPPTTVLSRLWFGGKDELAARAADVKRIAGQFPTDRAVAEAVQAARRPIATAGALYRTSLGLDFADKAQLTRPIKDLPLFRQDGSAW